MSRSSSSMGGLGKFTELRQRLLFVLGALLVYRVGSFIPVPGVNPDAMLALMEQQKGTIVDMFNMFSGGALSRFSLRSEEHTSELQSLMRISYAVFCLKKKNTNLHTTYTNIQA